MGGMISTYKKLQTKSGSSMAFVTVEDMYGTVECVCFPKTYDKIRGFLQADKVVSLSGKIDISEEKAPVIIVDKMTEFVPPEEKTAETVKPAANGQGNPAGGAVLLAVGLAGCLLCLLEWFGVPLSIAAGQNRTLTVFALLLFGGIRCVLPERNLVCQSKS